MRLRSWCWLTCKAVVALFVAAVLVLPLITAGDTGLAFLFSLGLVLFVAGKRGLGAVGAQVQEARGSRRSLSSTAGERTRLSWR